MVSRERQHVPTSPPPLLVAVRALYEAMHRFDGVVADRLGVHRSDLRCLNALEQGGLTAGEIGGRLALSSGSVTALVDRLVRAGMVVRTTDHHDRRRTLVELAPGAHRRLDEAYGVLGRTIGARFADAPATHASIAAGVVTTLAEAFDASAAAGRGTAE